MSKKIITLTTDFGLKDSYVAQMKGVILNINPDINIVDISHSIEPFNILEASYIISNVYNYFPLRTIHIIVVDPGVGTNRRILLAVGEKDFYIAPDNGVLSKIFEIESVNTVIEIDASHYYLNSGSNTFQGRDILAPIAGQLSKGIEPDKFGFPINDPVLIKTHSPLVSKDGNIKGVVMRIDNFGNIITNITKQMFNEIAVRKKARRFLVKLGDFNIVNMVKNFADAPKDKPCILFGSKGTIEIILKENSAADALKTNQYDEVFVLFQ